MIAFDHLAVAAETLEEGVEYVEDLLGVATEPGGRHAAMGTWNHVLSLGKREYLEVISVDPNAAHPGRPRWFSLDEFSGPPRLVTWICRANDLDAEIAGSEVKIGQPEDLQRGDFRWSFAVPNVSAMPFEGAHPALMQWKGPHPASQLPDRGLRMKALEITHSDPSLQHVLAISDDRITFQTGPDKALRACLSTPRGEVWLS